VFWYLYADPYQTELNGRRPSSQDPRRDRAGQKVARRLPEFRKGVATLESQLDALRMQLPEEQDVADLCAACRRWPPNRGSPSAASRRRR
jgi:Tfp pilus assembly protein PilO